MAELDGVQQVCRQKSQERLQPRDVLRRAVETGRQLVEQRAEAVAEEAGAGEDALQRLLRSGQAADVGQAPAGLDGEAEPLRDRPAPQPPRALLRLAVKAGVQLNRR